MRAKQRVSFFIPAGMTECMQQSDLRNILTESFVQSAYVKDARKGYIVVKNFNLTIDPKILEIASQCWAAYFADQQIDAIVGLPDAGNRLVSILAQLLQIPEILPSKRSATIPGSWQDVVSYTNTSFTMAKDGVHSHIGFVRPGMRVLLVDDVIAYGQTALAAITALQKAGVTVVGLATLFDKEWQGGAAKLSAETTIEICSLISIKKITESGEIILKNKRKDV